MTTSPVLFPISNQFFDLATDVNPFAFGGVAAFAVVSLAGEHGDGIDGIPGEVSTHAETAVVVFGQFQRFIARAGLRAREVDDVRERAIERFLRNRDLPRFIEHFLIRGVVVIEKKMLADETAAFGATPGFGERVEANLGCEGFADFSHVPEVRMGVAKLGLRPCHPNSAMPAVIVGMIAGDKLPARRIHRMQMRTVLKNGIHALGHLTSLHLVITDGFASGCEAEDGTGFFGGDIRSGGLTDKKAQKGTKE